MKLDVVDPGGKSLDPIEVDDAVFGIEPNRAVVHQTLLATAGAGGPLGATAAAAVSLAVMADGKTLAQAMAAPRPPARGNGNGGGRVQALWCPEGIRIGPESCQFASDPRAFGLAAFDKF